VAALGLEAGITKSEVSRMGMPKPRLPPRSTQRTGCLQIKERSPRVLAELLTVGRLTSGFIGDLQGERDAGARRVVLTSSFVAVGSTPKPGNDDTEPDWTDPDTPGRVPYPRSKAIAERAAWDFVEHESGDTELVAVKPTSILGPALTAQARSSLQLIRRCSRAPCPPGCRQALLGPG
jgi:hypothetical protein